MTAPQALFEGLPVAQDPWSRSVWTVMGGNYEDYIAFRSDPENRKIRTVCPRLEYADPVSINGICLDPASMAMPEIFWSQHEPLGTRETFEKLAVQLSSVRERLDAGEELDALLSDPWLGKCASVYYGRRNNGPVPVVKGPGFLYFQYDGRHRTLAARLAGLEEIPVTVIGEIV